MANTTNLNIRIDRDLKAQADDLLGRMGLNLSTAVNVFVRQMVNERAIPFRIHLNDKEIRERALNAFKKAQEESVINGTSEMTMEEIDAELAAYRREKRETNAKHGN